MPVFESKEKSPKPKIFNPKRRWPINPVIFLAVIITALVLGGLGGYYFQTKNQFQQSAILGEESNPYLVFTSEIYDKIKENHWKKISDEDLVSLFFLATEKLTGQPQNPKEKNRQSLLVSLREILKQIDDQETKEEFIIQLNNLVLNNLEPFGRSHLYSQAEEQELNDIVRNVADQDHYQMLGIDQKASQEKIAQVYQSQIQELAQDNTPQAQEKLDQINRAYEILKDEEARQIYDVSGIEPTMSYRLINNSIFHIHLKKFSPTTFDELQRITQKVQDQPGVDTLIFDLRDNIGGAIDGLPYFLGPFIGQDQYAYQFFHQDEKSDYKTRTGWLPSLVQYKKVVILINENSQSSAEVMASVLKKYNVGVLVGNTTRGWGTVEKVFKLDNQINQNQTYSAFLVHSLTLREDGQPIEGLGVDPHVFIAQNNWQKELYSYLPDQNIIGVVANLFSEDKNSLINESQGQEAAEKSQPETTQ
ncbi:MAG: S41 family peptidase [Candidatus Shapirobacteria bacterium]|nr:S41 family peptidase [Candidatus Shapirobacteria bacterium]MDD5073605.1 S41 family peptidase [Candidatus Shapirobacteria bacterium]MDD5481358.1 S41 family peptidase [Candidatus Shapirobacteria bacterium]